MRKILFGGAFDPIHEGHIKMARNASKQFDADVIFVPAAKSPVPASRAYLPCACVLRVIQAKTIRVKIFFIMMLVVVNDSLICQFAIVF